MWIVGIVDTDGDLPCAAIVGRPPVLGVTNRQAGRRCAAARTSGRLTEPRRHADPWPGRPSVGLRPAEVPEVSRCPVTPRRIAAPLALLAGVAIALTACGAPALPALTDPTEIVTAALKATEGAKSVHVDVTLDGTINADLTGSGTATDLPLNGTTATADVDMAGGKAHATFAIPAFLNLNGELIQIGETLVRQDLADRPAVHDGSRRPIRCRSTRPTRRGSSTTSATSSWPTASTRSRATTSTAAGSSATRSRSS